jgi:hypothetical protein
MTVSVRIAEITKAAAGNLTAVVVIKPSELTAFRVEVVFADKGNQENNLHHVQEVLQRFSADFASALRRPLKIAPGPAAKA